MEGLEETWLWKERRMKRSHSITALFCFAFLFATLMSWAYTVFLPAYESLDKFVIVHINQYGEAHIELILLFINIFAGFLLFWILVEELKSGVKNGQST